MLLSAFCQRAFSETIAEDKMFSPRRLRWEVSASYYFHEILNAALLPNLQQPQWQRRWCEVDAHIRRLRSELFSCDSSSGTYEDAEKCSSITQYAHRQKVNSGNPSCSVVWHSSSSNCRSEHLDTQHKNIPDWLLALIISNGIIGVEKLFIQLIW